MLIGALARFPRGRLFVLARLRIALLVGGEDRSAESGGLDTPAALSSENMHGIARSEAGQCCKSAVDQPSQGLDPLVRVRYQLEALRHRFEGVPNALLETIQMGRRRSLGVAVCELCGKGWQALGARSPIGAARAEHRETGAQANSTAWPCGEPTVNRQSRSKCCRCPRRARRCERRSSLNHRAAPVPITGPSGANRRPAVDHDRGRRRWCVPPMSATAKPLQPAEEARPR